MEELDCILSLTTWKKRIYDRKLLYVLQKALTQKTKYKYKLVLALSEEEFPKKNNEIPKELIELEKLCDGKFEILWTYRNTRALKKLNPAMHKWPELPILCFDDDMILTENAVEIFMNKHRECPKLILGCGAHPLSRGGKVYNKIWIRSCMRLFPPHSLAELNDEDFMKYFKGLEDDVWNGVRSAITGYGSYKMGINGITVDESWFPTFLGKDSALGLEYRFTNAFKMVDDFLDAHPEYKKYCK